MAEMNNTRLDSITVMYGINVSATCTRMTHTLPAMKMLGSSFWEEIVCVSVIPHTRNAAAATPERRD